MRAVNRKKLNPDPEQQTKRNFLRNSRQTRIEKQGRKATLMRMKKLRLL